jgi:hypothetical protein
VKPHLSFSASRDVRHSFENDPLDHDMKMLMNPEFTSIRYYSLPPESQQMLKSPLALRVEDIDGSRQTKGVFKFSMTQSNIMYIHIYIHSVSFLHSRLGWSECTFWLLATFFPVSPATHTICTTGLRQR